MCCRPGAICRRNERKPSSNAWACSRTCPSSRANQHLNDPQLTRGMSEEDALRCRRSEPSHVGGARTRQPIIPDSSRVIRPRRVATPLPRVYSVTQLRHATPSRNSVTQLRHATPSRNSSRNPSRNSVTQLRHATPSRNSVTQLRHATPSRNFVTRR